MTTRPLQGIKLLDFTTLLPGPLATLLLVEAGAEVVKLERPGTGEDMRAYTPKWGRDSVSFALLNRGKKSLAIDLKDAAQRRRLRPLLEEADVLVEQFRPGVMARLGLDYDSLKAVNPRLIYCSITGYGQHGPKRDVAGHDLNYIGDSGLLSLGTGDPARPMVPPALVADIAGGSYPAVINILLALMQRARTGEGAHLDIAMCDNLFPFMFWALGKVGAGGPWPENGAELLTGGSPRYGLYPTADGRILAVAALEDRFWRRFCKLIDAPEEIDIESLRRTILGKPAAHWRALFEGEDCCCSIVASLEEALADPHFKARGLFAHQLANERGDTQPALPLPLAGAFRAPRDVPLAAPGLGEHEDDLLR
jgi:crotonobetainyl-CoA:carnitine CoA-transferase CaiB-like acyl-CoA transferase